MLHEAKAILLKLGAIRRLPPLCPWERPLSRIQPYLRLRLVVSHEGDDSGRITADLCTHKARIVSAARRRRSYRVPSRRSVF
jgi:hypothetical protein